MKDKNMSDDLQKQLNNLNAQIKTISAQAETFKQMFNESLQTSVNLRSNLILLQQENQELKQKIAAIPNTSAKVEPVIVPNVALVSEKK
jgi:uncharacterized protein involved in exopolysaccharide biosynthesis